MKRFLLILLLLFTVIVVLKFSLPKNSHAQTETINVADYIIPEYPYRVQVSSGETFYTIPGPESGEYILCKNADCSSYEMRFVLSDGIGLQGESYWVGPDTTFRYLHPDGSLADWLPLTMSVGSTHSPGDIIVQGYYITADGLVPFDAPYGGPSGGTVVLLESVGPVEFPSGLIFGDVAIFRVIAGPGAGEAFYFAKGIGQIGWGPNIPVAIEDLPPEQLEEILESLLLQLDISSFPQTQHVCSAPPSAMKPTTFRPAPCESCSDPFQTTVDSCATEFQVVTVGAWCLTPEECDGDFHEFYDWKGNVVIDFTETKVPFAGFGDSIDPSVNERLNPSTTKYLADYFTGTFPYTGEIRDLSDPEEVKAVFREAGVFPKLAVQEYQDKLKCDILERAKKTAAGQAFYPVRNYEVEYGDQKMRLIQIECKPEKPSPDAPMSQWEDYLDRYDLWEDEFGEIWGAVPMFSREDGVGLISVSAYPPGKITNSPFRATFPHLPRLHEVTEELQEMLYPQMGPHSASLAEKRVESLLASSEKFSPESCQPENQLLAQRDILLAQAANYSVEIIVSSTYYPETNTVSFQFYVQGYRPGGGIHPENFHVWINGQLVSVSPSAILSDNTLVAIPGGWGEIDLIPPGDCATASVYFWVKDVPEGAPQEYSRTCTFCAVEGELQTDCQDEVPVSEPEPVCQSPDSRKGCLDKRAKSDYNPNDPICVAESENGVLTAELVVDNYEALITRGEVEALQAEYDKCMRECEKEQEESEEEISCSCPECSTVDLTRWISIKTKIPLLDKIWKQTTNLDKESEDIFETGIFHIFTPGDLLENWKEKQAKSPIAKYSFEEVKVNGGDAPGSASPNEGELYYPKLGGVQEAKKCVSEIMLLPKDAGNRQFLCPPFREGGKQSNM